MTTADIHFGKENIEDITKRLESGDFSCLERTFRPVECSLSFSEIKITEKSRKKCAEALINLSERTT